MDKLKRGQIITINNENYIVDNMIEFKEDSWKWQEYEIKNKNDYEKYWLTIEEVENQKVEYYLYKYYDDYVDTNKIEFEYNGEKYTLFESGKATVKSYFGPTDVDMGETCKYYDYINNSEDKIISVEIWSDETEYTIGNKIQDYEIQIKNEIDEEYLKKNKVYSSKLNILSYLFIGLLILFPFFSNVFGGLFVNKSMDKYIAGNTSKYTYVTSVTNNSNNKKAKVYVTIFSSPDEAVKDIIDGVPEGITEVIDDDTTSLEDGYGLETKNEYAYIYLEDDKIYVQISNKEYVNSFGTTYHSSHNSYYHSSYNSKHRSTSYYSYASSARQSSINSRTYSGGGTSGGK